MDFLDTIFSFIPLLVLVLFFTRIAKAAGKKKKSKQSEQPSPDKKTGGGSIKQAESAEDFSSLMAKLGGRSAAEKIRQDFVKKKDAAPVKTGKKEPLTEAKPEPEPKPVKTIKHVRPPEYQALNSLHSKSAEIKPESGKSRFDSLPELKKAVVWAEILGKPKSLE